LILPDNFVAPKQEIMVNQIS